MVKTGEYLFIVNEFLKSGTQLGTAKLTLRALFRQPVKQMQNENADFGKQECVYEDANYLYWMHAA